MIEIGHVMQPYLARETHTYFAAMVRVSTNHITLNRFVETRTAAARNP